MNFHREEYNYQEYDCTVFTAHIITGTDENEKQMIVKLNPSIKDKNWKPCVVIPALRPNYTNVKCKVLTTPFTIGSTSNQLIVIELKDSNEICLLRPANLNVIGHMCDAHGCHGVAVHKDKQGDWVCPQHFRTYP